MRLIDANAAIDRYYADFEYHCIKMLKDEDEWLRQCIDEAPTIEAEPVRHGRWEIELDEFGWNKHTCPLCGYVKRTDIHVSLGWNYCPNCGAKMDLEGK